MRTADNTVTGNTTLPDPGQVVTGLLNVIDGVYESHSDYVDVNIAAAGTLSLTGPITVSGNWTKDPAGTFTHNNFGVTFDGDGVMPQTIAGDTTFYDFTKTTAAAQTMNFTAGSTTTVSNSLTFAGAAGQILSLRSTSAPTQWNLNASATQSVSYVDVQDSNASSGNTVVATHSVNSGNNDNWIFEYTLTYTSGGNGMISGTSPQTVTYGNSGSSVTAVPASGYQFVDWSDSSTDNPRTDTNVQADATYTANFEVTQYSVMYDGNGHTGGTAPATQTADYNTSVTLATAGTLVKSGSSFTGWNTQADGLGTHYAAGGGFTIPASNTTLYAEWSAATYTITVTQTANGQISPGTSSVSAGLNKVFYIVPDPGYGVATLVVDGMSVPIGSPYTFTNVSANHTITATYAAEMCRVLSIPDLHSQTGVEVSIPVNTADVTGGNILSAEFRVDYDPLVVTPIAGADNVVVTPGPVLPPGASIYINKFATYIEFSINSATPFTGTGALVNIHMNVIGSSGSSTGSTLLTLGDLDPMFPNIFYNGGTSCATATSGSLTVDPIPTTTTVVSSMNPSVYGTAVTFTATVSPNPGGGTVQFNIDGINVGSAVTVDGSGQATFMTSTLTVAGSPHSVTATYSGFAPYDGSVGMLTPGQTVTPRALTVTATGVNKGYDGNADATVTLSDDRVGGDILTDSYTSASFDDKNVGTGKPVSVSGISISGAAAGNYNLLNTTASTTANITARDLTVTATGINKEYDGNATATVNLSDDRVLGDVFTDSYTGASFDNKNVGVGKPVNVSGISISGADAGNYNLLNTTASTTANITPRDLTVTATGINKEYDGNATATVNLSDDRVLGDVFTDSYTGASFDNKNVGVGKPVNVSGISISGADAGNYNLLNTTASTTANITARDLTVTATGINKVYDGNADATVTLSDDRVGGDVFTDSYTSASFNNKNVGTGKPVSVTGISISGADAGNYNLLNTTAATTADITARDLTVSATGINKVYDGDATATVTLSDNRVLGDVFTDSYTSASFNDKNAGIGKPVSRHRYFDQRSRRGQLQPAEHDCFDHGGHSCP